MSTWVFGNVDYISHHGVEGQKWGVRHGPPYPLDREAKKEVRKQIRSNTKEIKREARFERKNFNAEHRGRQVARIAGTAASWLGGPITGVPVTVITSAVHTSRVMARVNTNTKISDLSDENTALRRALIRRA